MGRVPQNWGLAILVPWMIIWDGIWYSHAVWGADFTEQPDSELQGMPICRLDAYLGKAHSFEIEVCG